MTAAALAVSEVFGPTFQGEGPSAGRRCGFVRLARCNLTCRWCDTPYTWDWTRFDAKKESVELDVAAIAERVAALGSVRTAVLTGGEPLLQQRELAELAARLRAAGKRVEVETNGTIVPDAALVDAVDQWNVSPKLASSGNLPIAREKADALAWFAAAPNAFFKLVITSPADVEEAAALVERHRVPASRVVLMPEGTAAETIVERSRWLAEAAVARGYRLGSRLHVLLWGDTRGR